MNYLALSIPKGPGQGSVQVKAPGDIPTGGLPIVAKVIGNAITFMLIITVILTLIFLVWGGVQWIQSGGDKQKVAQARSRITYSIIGLIIALAAFFILNVIGFMFKVNLTKIG